MVYVIFVSLLVTELNILKNLSKTISFPNVTFYISIHSRNFWSVW